MPLSWRIGAVTVTRFVELETVGGSRFILPQATREAVAGMNWMKPHFIDDEGRLKMSIHALVIDTPTHRIIVDTCLGNDKQGRSVPGWNQLQGSFLSDLVAAGHAPDSIDTVLCTHMHVDHVGWNTMLVDGAWVPTFPNARYLFARSEFEHWRGVDDHGDQSAVFADSVRPILEAGLADFVDTDHQVCDEVRLVPTPGHTPGHVSVAISSQGRRALISGDFVHHPCQMARPDWTSTADCDPEQAILTRRRMFGQLASAGTLLIGTHFSAPTAGRVILDGECFRFDVTEVPELEPASLQAVVGEMK